MSKADVVLSMLGLALGGLAHRTGTGRGDNRHNWRHNLMRQIEEIEARPTINQYEAKRLEILRARLAI